MAKISPKENIFNELLPLIFFFIIIIFRGSSIKIFNEDIINLINNNIYINHLIGFFGMFIFISMLYEMSVWKILYYSIVLYGLYILIANLTVKWFFAVLILIAAAYTYQRYLDY